MQKQPCDKHKKLNMLCILCIILLTGVAFLLPELAYAAEGTLPPEYADRNRFALQSNLDHVWITIAAALVLMMQLGFLLLESGSVRSKNSINVAQKNIADFIISTTVFFAIGYCLMFGNSVNGLFGWNTDLIFFSNLEDWSLTFFFFQLVFCGTAVTIMSGACAERMHLTGFLICAAIIGLIIYPISGHWAWGNLLYPDNQPWLAGLGFIDFAGSSVVHSVGGWAGLAICLIIGPRIDKYGNNGQPTEIKGHNAILATAGCIILWVGWIGFNGGSTIAGTSDFAHIIVNTVIAGAAGGLIQMLIGRFEKGLFKPKHTINGILAGLVGITAGCNAVTALSAWLIGASSGLIAYYSIEFLEKHFRVDDPLGAISVHGTAGAWGTIMVAIMARPDALLAGSRVTQIGVQCLGVAVFFLWAFGVTYILLKILDYVTMTNPGGRSGLRVSETDEKDGLNIAEHGETLSISDLQRAMTAFALDHTDASKRLAVEQGNEASDLCLAFNHIMDNLQDWQIAQNETQNNFAIRHQKIEKTIAHYKLALPQHINTLLEMCEIMNETISSLCQSSKQSKNCASGIAKGVEDNSSHVDIVAGATKQMHSSISQITADVSNSDKAASDAFDQAQKTTDIIQGLKQSSQNIREILSFIQAIASKTNLLALNASIEAARSGEAGLSFAVVAQEIKNLANQVSGATDQIGAQIEEMTNVSDQVAEAVENIQKTIKENNNISGEISSKINEQENTVHEVARNIEDMAEKLRDIFSDIDGITQTTDNTLHSSHSVMDVAEKVIYNSMQLENRIQDFFKDVSYIDNNNLYRVAHVDLPVTIELNDQSQSDDQAQSYRMRVKKISLSGLKLDGIVPKALNSRVKLSIKHIDCPLTGNINAQIGGNSYIRLDHSETQHDAIIKFMLSLPSNDLSDTHRKKTIGM